MKLLSKNQKNPTNYFYLTCFSRVHTQLEHHRKVRQHLEFISKIKVQKNNSNLHETPFLLFSSFQKKSPASIKTMLSFVLPVGPASGTTTPTHFNSKPPKFSNATPFKWQNKLTVLYRNSFFSFTASIQDTHSGSAYLHMYLPMPIRRISLISTEQLPWSLIFYSIFFSPFAWSIFWTGKEIISFSFFFLK